VLGNSEFHANALAALRRRPGTVLCHEVRLSGLLALSLHTRDAVPGGLETAIACDYPGLPEGLGRGGSVGDADAERYGLYLLKDVAPDADRVLVFSEAARRLADVDVGPSLAGRLGVVPYAVSQLPPEALRAVAAARAGQEPAGRRSTRQSARRHGRRVVSSFGIVDPRKRPETMVEAVAVLARDGHDVELRMVGPVSERMASTVRALATSLGVGDRVHVDGEVSRDRYLSLLGRTEVAVQLRDRFSGECSGTVCECLSAGVPTVVSAIGWMAEIPSDAVCAAAPDCDGSTLADVVRSLLSTEGRRAALGEAGRRWAEERTFDVTAAALLEVMGVAGVGTAAAGRGRAR
jgi:glycosyltransferase involved in cell wall biosynthesis